MEIEKQFFILLFIIYQWWYWNTSKKVAEFGNLKKIFLAGSGNPKTPEMNQKNEPMEEVKVMEQSKELSNEILQKNIVMGELLNVKQEELRRMKAELESFKAVNAKNAFDLLVYSQVVQKMSELLPETKEEEKFGVEKMKNIISVDQIEEEKGSASSKEKEEPVELNFFPEESKIIVLKDDDVSVVSEFTQWKPVRLDRENRAGRLCYVQKFMLYSGYKYKFRFVVNGAPITVANYPSISSSMGEMYNYIVVSDGSELSLEKIPSFINPFVTEDKRKQAIDKYFLRKKEVQKKEKRTFEGNLTILIGRLLFKFTPPEGVFKMMKWKKDSREAFLKRLTDNNRVPLAEKSHRSEYFFLNELNDNFIMFGPPDQEKEFIRSIKSNGRLKIVYKVMKDPFSMRNMCETLCLEPDVPLTDYVIDFDETSRKIRNVFNCTFGEVLFEQEKVDADSGYIKRSLIEVYTNIKEEGVLNILHIHLEDTSDLATVDVVSTLSELELSPKLFGKDASGRPLRYKIVVNNDGIHKIYYNNGNTIESLKFQEHKFKVGEHIFLEEVQTFAKISSIPVSLLTALESEKLTKYQKESVAYEPNGVCQKRGFEDLPGYVDLEILSEGDPGAEFFISMPICSCKKLTSAQKFQLEVMKHQQDLSGNEQIKKIIFNMKEELDNYELNKATLSLEVKEALLSKLSESEAKVVEHRETTMLPEDLQEVFRLQCERFYKLSKEVIGELRLKKFAK